MKKNVSNAVLAFAVGLVFLGISVTFYFRANASVATYLIVLCSGVVLGSSLVRGILYLREKPAEPK
jgi:hypothetical protein